MTDAISAAEIDEALDAAQRWLERADRLDAAGTYSEASSYFRRHVKSDDWRRMLLASREPLGALKWRKQAATQPTTTAPGAPDGKYVVITYESSFEHKQSAVETVTPMLDDDGAWRVSGYYIR